MNDLDDITLQKQSFAYRDIIGQDGWEAFVPVFTSLTVIGATTYVGRFHITGRQCHFQITLLAATSIASTAGTTYMSLPLLATGITGMGVMDNATTRVTVGGGSIDVTNSRYYLPAQLASGNTFAIAGWFEVA